MSCPVSLDFLSLGISGWSVFCMMSVIDLFIKQCYQLWGVAIDLLSCLGLADISYCVVAVAYVCTCHSVSYSFWTCQSVPVACTPVFWSHRFLHLLVSIMSFCTCHSVSEAYVLLTHQWLVTLCHCTDCLLSASSPCTCHSVSLAYVHVSQCQAYVTVS